MVVGNPKKIDLSTSSFERMIERGNLYVDKTRIIENFIEEASSVQLITRQRRLGKSLNMDTIRCFLTDKVDNRHLFKGLYIEQSHVWKYVNSSPVFYFNFKGLNVKTYRERVHRMIRLYIENYCQTSINKNVEQYLSSKNFDDTDGFYYLTEAVYETTGKRSYLLIDEYDKMLMDNYKTDKYEEIRQYETLLFSAGFKDNPYLEKALITGVMRISRESLFSGLNNIKVFDIFSDRTYTDNYGLTEEEIDELQEFFDFDKATLKTWYNGIMVNGKPIYNTYSTMSFLDENKYKCFWAMSGIMDTIAELINENRRKILTKLLNGEKICMSIEERISLMDLLHEAGDEDFYSLIVQAGYLSAEQAAGETVSETIRAIMSIPNIELMLAWKHFILKRVFRVSSSHVRSVFENSDNLPLFAKDLERIITDRLSHHDLGSLKGEDRKKVPEILYHVFLLGLLCADGNTQQKYPLSNRESGDGRFDIFIERADGNFIFELKSSEKADNLEKDALSALEQITAKRYGAENSTKRLVKVGIAFVGKNCKISCDDKPANLPSITTIA
ncbi:MAG: ATP-binding protein [Turicibacter sp.]|nr:ATP-binding protein [Turicibacter sp.]